MRKSGHVLSFIGLLICWLGATGAGYVAEAKPYYEKLPNGMSVLIQETYASPTVSINIFVKAGSLYEDKEHSGISHFYEHMFFRGTPRRTGLRFKRAIEALGGTTNATTTRDFTHYYINLPSRYLDSGLELMADALQNAECSQEAVDKEREVVLEEFRLGLSSPARILSNRLFAMAFKSHPYSRPVIGYKDILTRISRQDLLDFKRKFYVPQRTSVVIVGDVDTKHVIEKVKKLFGGFRGRDIKDEQIPKISPPREPVVQVDDSKDGKSYVILGYVGPSIHDRPDIYRADVLTFMLGVGKGSLLYRELVDKGIAEAAQVDFLTQECPGLIIVTTLGSRLTGTELKDRVISVIDKIRQGKFSDRDLSRAKTMLASSFIFGQESNAGKADTLGFYAILGDWTLSQTYLDKINQVSKQDVIETADKYLGAGYYALVAQPFPRRSAQGVSR